VSLPHERAKACLRPPAGSSELEAVSATLTASEAPAEQSWQMRTRTTREKIALGDPVALAEIVRDAVERQRRLSSGSLSSLERELYEKARSLLAGELAVAACIDDAEAQEWISSRLALGAPTTLVP
jgi:RNA polymerase-interacting CarD/CdnL/TRCF family regulator